MKKLILIPALVLGACAKTIEVPVVKEVVREVKVPVSTPCVVNKPSPPLSLRDKISPADWRRLTTDQRENLLAAQGLDRVAYQEKLHVSTSGCL